MSVKAIHHLAAKEERRKMSTKAARRQLFYVLFFLLFPFVVFELRFIIDFIVFSPHLSARQRQEKLFCKARKKKKLTQR
jgi:hypothetical protein